MFVRTIRTLLVIVCFTLSSPVFAATMNHTSETLPTDKIDSLFAQWNHPNTPGYAVGIIEDGKLVFAKGYGMANLEQNVPITTDSPFYVGSMSKQFTAACAALLIIQGKLSMDDDVHKYIPELPAYPGRLTVGDLIYHTAGVREYTSLMLFSGQDTNFEQNFDNDDSMRLLTRQSELEFLPGSQYKYSGGNYVMLATVIEKVTGETLPEFAKKNLFTPLGMTNTFIDDDYTQILPGRVDSYRVVAPGHYARMLKHFNAYGDGGVVTTIDDMAKWDSNFYNPIVGGQKWLDLMLTKGKLNSGREIPYAFGLNVYNHHGYQAVEHGGYMLRFTSDILRFPDLHLSIVILGNTSEQFANNLAFKIADMLLPSPEKSDNGDVQSGTQSPSTSVPTAETLAQWTNLAGCYWNTKGNYYRRIVVENDHLTLDWGSGTNGDNLYPTGDSAFFVRNSGDPSQGNGTSITFQKTNPKSSNPSQMTMSFKDGSPSEIFERFNPSAPESLDEVKQFVGTYYSPDLDVNYKFAIQNGELTLQMGSSKPLRLYPAMDPLIIWNTKEMVWVRFGEIILRHDKHGAVNGLTIGDERVSAVTFNKIH